LFRLCGIFYAGNQPTRQRQATNAHHHWRVSGVLRRVAFQF
jgi:hypothetical protein